MVLPTRFQKGLFLAALLIAILLFFHFRDSAPKPEIKRSGTNLSLGLVKYLAAPIALPSSVAVTRAPSSACEEEIDAIANLDLTSFGQQDTEDRAFFSVDRPEEFFAQLADFSRAGNCASDAGVGRQPLLDALSEMNAACQAASRLGLEKSLLFPDPPLAEERMLQSPLDKCVNKLNEVRQEIAEFSTRNTPIELLRDIPTLTQKFMAQARKNPTDLKTMGLLARRLVELDPGSSEAHALALQIAYADWKKNPQSEEKQTRAALLQDSSDRLMELDPQNNFYAQYRLQFELESGNFSAVREIADKLMEDDSGLNLANYYLAQAAYRERDYEKAHDYLRRVVAGDFLSQKLEASLALQLLSRAPASEKAREPFRAPSVYFSGNGFSLVSRRPDGQTTRQLVGLASYPILEEALPLSGHPDAEGALEKALESLGTEKSESP